MKILIIGQDQGSMKNIKYDLNNLQDDTPVKIETARPSHINMVLDSRVKLMILDMPRLSNVVFQFVVQVRKAGFDGPILMIGNLNGDFDVQALAEGKDLYHITRPYVPKQFIGKVKEAMASQSENTRRDQRYSVQQAASVEAYASDFRGETTIRDISRSGVRIAGSLEGLKAGDLIKLHFNFDEINKERTMSARVVWKKKDYNDNDVQAGLEFVSQKVVYDYLLNFALT